MLEFKNDPQKLMMALEKFLSIYYADRQLGYQRDINEVLSWNIPKPLKYLYSFIEKYLGEYGNLCKQDSLIINSGNTFYTGKILIASENSGCWNLYTEARGEYPPVWTEDDGWKDDSPKWKIANESLSEFLVTFSLREVLLSSIYNYSFQGKIDNLLSAVKKQGYKIVLLWQGKYRQVEDDVMPKIDSFYLIGDSILLWDKWNGGWCATNNKDANIMLASIELEYELSQHSPLCCSLDCGNLKPF